MKIDNNFIILFLMFFCLAAFFFKGSYDDYRLQMENAGTLVMLIIRKIILRKEVWFLPLENKTHPEFIGILI
jgi:hypothetical protein